MDQPYSRMADMLLDTQWYNVSDPRPYDDTGWTLGPLHNVKTVRVNDVSLLKAPMTLVKEAVLTAKGGVTGSGPVVVVPNNAESQLATLRFRLKDVAMAAAEEPFEAGGRKLPAGSLIVAAEGNPKDARERLEREAGALGLGAIALQAAPGVKSHSLNVPRIALVHDWINTQNEGWWRIVFDRYGVPYDYVSVHEIRKTAELRSRFDVIIHPPTSGAPLTRQINGIQTKDAIPWTPSEKYPNLGGPDKTDDMRGGLGYQGLDNLRRFAESGGVLIAAANAATLPVETGMVEAVEVFQARNLQARGAVLRATVSDKGSPIAYGYGDTLGVYFNQAPVFDAGPGTALGGMRRFMEAFGPAGQGRVSGRGGPKDPDVPQGRAYVEPPPPPKANIETMADIPEEMLDFVRNVLPPQERWPRVVLKFAKAPELWISGMLDKGEELAEKPAVIDCPVGKGHVVLFSNNPMWRFETHGSHALVFNALLNWDDLGVGRGAKPAAPGPSE
jgi:hypothetical protein